VNVSAGTVTDNVTGLVWQRDVDANSYTWRDAQSYCQSLNLGGDYTGWRVPTLIELESIVDYGRTYPAINVIAFPSTTASFWSSTPYAYDTSYMWEVFFSDGSTSTLYTGYVTRVRCVR
jgi:hypothetical protein